MNASTGEERTVVRYIIFENKVSDPTGFWLICGSLPPQNQPPRYRYGKSFISALLERLYQVRSKHLPLIPKKDQTQDKQVYICICNITLFYYLSLPFREVISS